jgi:hypothetical protein
MTVPRGPATFAVVRRPIVLVAAIAVLLASSCRDDHVTIVFHPKPGAVLAYDIHVVSSSTTALDGQPVKTSPPAAADLTSRQHVLDVSGETARVEVELARVGIGTRTFIMRFDRAAQLTAVESVEGIPAEALGTLGLSEIFPASAGAPPDRPLRPGDRWPIDDRVQLAGMDAPAHLIGAGHLVELGVIDGHDTATVSSSTTLPLTSTTSTPEGVQQLRGTQTTTITVVYDLSNGAVRHSTAQTTGRFDVVLAPPTGQAGVPINGTLTVELRSEISSKR